MKPTKGPLSELTDDEFKEFIVCLGILVFKSPIAATFARHTHPFSTAQDYLHPDPSDTKPAYLAMAFWVDLCKRKLKTEDLSEKWFGGKEGMDAQLGDMPGRM
jgi:hypothetical protein